MSKPPSNKHNGFVRVGVFPIEDVLPFVVDPPHDKRDKSTRREYVSDKGTYMVKMHSLRLRTFAKSTVCSCCGLKGSFFALEQTKHEEPPHLNLYAINADGQEVLMTKDHIVPMSRGGADCLSNLQTMCKPCNECKGNNEDN